MIHLPIWFRITYLAIAPGLTKKSRGACVKRFWQTSTKRTKVQSVYIVKRMLWSYDYPSVGEISTGNPQGYKYHNSTKPEPCEYFIIYTALMMASWDVMTWKRVPPFVRGIHRWPVVTNGQWWQCKALLVAWTSSWTNKYVTSVLRRRDTSAPVLCDVTIIASRSEAYVIRLGHGLRHLGRLFHSLIICSCIPDSPSRCGSTSLSSVLWSGVSAASSSVSHGTTSSWRLSYMSTQ